jgi:hypothetical protein
MAVLSLESMRAYLSRSITSLNQNKLRGLLAEVDMRAHFAELGFGDRISRGGWILRTKGPGIFANSTVALFPEVVDPGVDYAPGRALPHPELGLHTIGTTFHQSGISSFFCAATVSEADDPASLEWQAIQLGIPVEQPYEPFIPRLSTVGFALRDRRYNFLRYAADADTIPAIAVPEEFTKEHLRIAFSTHFMAEPSDIDGLFWGAQHTYPIEVKEKTPSDSRDLGLFFGLDIGPFVKLAYYAAKRGNLRSLYVVREIDNATDRNLVRWAYITFDHLAQFASWVPMAGGTNMQGGASAVVRIPRSEFTPLTAETLALL